MSAATMTTLSYEPDANGFVQPLAKVTLKTGREVWVCNPYEDVRDAHAEGASFEAHAVVALAPKPITLNPAHIAAIEAL